MQRHNVKSIRKNKIGNRKAGPRTSQNKSLQPPHFVAQALRSIRIRTIASGAVNLAITMQQLGQLLGCMAISTTASNLISPLTRVKRISIWAPVSTAGTSVTCQMTWVNMSEDFESPPVTFSDSSVSFDRPAYISQRPPRGALSGKWHSNTLTDSLVTIISVAGTVVDFELEFSLIDDVNNFAAIAGPTLVAATVGQIYHHPIGVLIPQTVNSL